VGVDALPQLKAAFEGHDIDLSDLAISQDPSYHEVTVHEDLEGRTILLLSERNCFDAWKPSMSAPAAVAPICFVGSAPPDTQLRLLDQTRARIIGVDTMMVHLTEAPQSALAVLRRARFLFLNEQELTAVGELLNLPAYIRSNVTTLAHGVLEALPGKIIIVKRGPAGVYVASERTTFSLPAIRVQHVQDPSGAGDALAGGIFGALSQVADDRGADLTKLVNEGLHCAALAISEFGVTGLTEHRHFPG
jgi:sugar/nucleoside kinase (ribokinase family)